VRRAPALPVRTPDRLETADAVVDDEAGTVFFKQGFVVQSLIFPKAHWNSAAACQKWARDHDFRADKVDETADSYRLRQRDPGDFERIRTICVMPKDAGAAEARCQIKAVGGPLKEAGAPRDLPPRVLDLGDIDAGLVVASWLQEYEKGVIPYRRTALAPEGESWDGAAELASADLDDLRVMCASYGAGGEDKADYLLPHHKADGEHACVWRAVANAAARLPLAKLAAANLAGVRRHLGRHYEDFAKDAPWKAAPEAWQRFETTAVACGNMATMSKRELTAAELAGLLREFGFEPEARAVEAVADVAAAADLLTSMGMRTTDPGAEPVSDADLRQMHRELLEPAIDAQIRKRMGKLD
jgi:hypothetical protein